MPKKIVLVGSGSAIIGYLSALRSRLVKGEDPKGLSITICKKSQIAGSGLPYDPTMTSPEHLFNAQTLSSVIPITSLDGSNRPDRASFIEWLNKPETKIYLRGEFEKIFSERFKRAYRRKFGEFDEASFAGKNIFDPAFQESEFYKQNQGNAEFLEMLRYHQDKFQSYVRKVEENAKNPYGFLPRIVYGFYSKALFDYQVDELRARGVTFDVRCETEVIALDRAADKKVSAVTTSKDGTRRAEQL